VTWRRLKQLCVDAGQYGLNVPAGDYVDEGEGVRLIRTSDLAGGQLRPDSDGIFVPGPVPEQFILEPRDILLSRSGTIGRSFLVPAEAAGRTFAGFLVRFRPRADQDARYLAYALQSQHAQAQVQADAIVSTIQNFNAERYANLSLWMPLEEDQRRIADFLHHQVDLLDRAIALRQQQVALTKERWVADNNAAIRGLDGSPTQHVGGWLGRINDSWRLSTLSRLADTYAGAGFPLEYQGRETGDLPFLKVADLAMQDPRGNVTTARNYISKATARLLGARPVPSGTVIFPKVGAALLTNTRALLSTTAVVDNNVMGVHPRDGDARYWRYLMLGIDLGEFANPGPVPSINDAQIRALMIPLVSRDSQRSIADSLDKRAEVVAEAVALLTRSLALLLERKQSLITAAVTGQFDVSTARSVA